MPLYEYECESCQERFERLQRLADPPVETCPACEGKVRKLISPSGLSFKGSGWYITDYAKKSETAAVPAAGQSKDAKSDAKSDAKTDAKPASAPTEKAASSPSTPAEGKPKPAPAATSS